MRDGVEVEARCVDCGERWWVKAGEVKAGDMPACPRCGSVGVATGRARRRGGARKASLAAVLLALAPLAADAGPARAAATVRAFRRANPCPATGKRTGACPGYVVDHRIPLCAGGPDDVRNMAWQPAADAAWKDGIERELCARLKRCEAQP